MDVNAMSVISKRGLQDLPPTVGGRFWQGRGGAYGVHTRRSLVEIAQQLYPGMHLPVSLTKAHLVALIDAFDSEQASVQDERYNGMQPDNEECPISQEKLEEPFFVRESSTGYKRGFTLELIADYFLATGCTSDPIDREPFSAEDLARMDRQLRKAGLRRRSVAKINTPAEQRRYREQKDREEQIEVMHDVLDEALESVIRDASRGSVLPHALSNVDMRSFYTFRRHSRMLARADLSDFFEYITAASSAIAANDDLNHAVKHELSTFLVQVAGEVLQDPSDLPVMPMGSFVDDPLHDSLVIMGPMLMQLASRAVIRE